MTVIKAFHGHVTKLMSEKLSFAILHFIYLARVFFRPLLLLHWISKLPQMFPLPYDLLPFMWLYLSSSLLGYLWSMFSLRLWLLGDVLDEGAEDGHLLGEAGLCALLLLHAHVLRGKVTDAVVKALLSCVEEVLCLRLEINEGTWVFGVLFVHY